MLPIMSNPFMRSLFTMSDNDTFNFQNFLTMVGSSFIESEDKQTATLNMDVPGMTESDITVSLDKNIIDVRGERQGKGTNRKINSMFSVPSGYDAASMSAQIENGVLSLTVSRLPEAKAGEAKKIEIKMIKSKAS